WFVLQLISPQGTTAPAPLDGLALVLVGFAGDDPNLPALLTCARQRFFVATGPDASAPELPAGLEVTVVPAGATVEDAIASIAAALVGAPGINGAHLDELARLEAAGDWERVVELQFARVEALRDPVLQSRALRALAYVLEQRLGAPDRAHE